jgi:hypothetical protein
LITQLTVAITLAGVGVAQALLTQVLVTLGSDWMYRRLLGELTRTEIQLGFKKFFHTEDVDGFRLDKIAGISTIAGAVTTQCVALVLTAAGTGALAWAALATGQGWGWFAGSIALGAMALGLLAILLVKFSRKKLLTFGMGLRGDDKTGLKGFFLLRSAAPFICFQLAATAFAAVAGVIF